uniref:RING-type domain-containing protein n=1 Tax=Alexandrium andersonii TaxID=327968 RepID=A0A7S2NLE8_9DINO
MCYVWVVIHMALGGVAWVLERRVRRAEGDLRAVEDDDTVARWGQVSTLSGYDALGGTMDKGLTPAQIQSLPCEIATQEDKVELGEEEPRECPICINDIQPGDNVRKLPGCEHVFHRSCIDLWLLRRADCPLCKRDVRKDLAAKACTPVDEVSQ